MNIERLSARPETEETFPARPPTALQTFLHQQGIHRSKILANPRHLTSTTKIPDRVKLRTESASIFVASKYF